MLKACRYCVSDAFVTHLEHLLCAWVKLLSIVVHLLDLVVALHVSVDVMREAR